MRQSKKSKSNDKKSVKNENFAQDLSLKVDFEKESKNSDNLQKVKKSDKLHLFYDGPFDENKKLKNTPKHDELEIKSQIKVQENWCAIARVILKTKESGALKNLCDKVQSYN